MGDVVRTPRRATKRRARAARRRGAPVLLALAVAVGTTTGCDPVPTVLDLTVTVETDGADASPGDGACATVAGSCTLRAAVAEANATAGRDRITIAAGVDPVLSLPGAGDDANASGDLDIAGDLVIEGGGATVDAAGLDRVVDVRSGRVTLRHLTLTGGHPPRHEGSGLDDGAGGGVRALDDVALEWVRIEGNVAEQSTEGSALFASGAAVTLTFVEVTDNHFLSTGGAGTVMLRDGSGLSLSRSTIDSPDDEAVQSYGSNVVVADSTLHAREALHLYQATGVVVRSTLVGVDDSRFSWLVWQYGGTLHVGGSILDQPSGGGSDPVCNSGAVTSLGWNVASDSTCTLAGTGDHAGDPVRLGPLADNGGPTRTFLPAANSPAVDRIPSGTALYCDGVLDQRGVGRPVGSACEAGSVEGAGGSIDPLHLVVDVATDGIDVAPGDRACATVSGSCTLRAAVMEANAANAANPSLADVISIAAGVDPVLALPGAGEDGAATGDLDIDGAVVIEGGGATVDGAGLDRVIEVHGQVPILRDLIVTGGAASAPGTTADGGGILATGIRLEGVTVRANSATGSGGGIAGGTDGGITLVDSDVDANHAGRTGGGITAATLSVQRSLIRSNSAGWSGGAIGSEGIGYARVEDSTITANSAPSGAAASLTGALDLGLDLVRSTVAGNTGSTSLSGVYRQVCTRVCIPWTAVRAEGSIIVAPPGLAACDATVAGGRFNLVSDATCGPSVAGDAGLGALADNGGPTPTLLPAIGAGGIDAVPTGTAGLCDPGLIDQRGVTRPVGATCDVGAVEQ